MENDEKTAAASAATLTTTNSFASFDFSNKINGINLQTSPLSYEKLNGNAINSSTPIVNNSNHNNNHEAEEEEAPDDSCSSSNELVIDQDAENSSDSRDYDDDESNLDGGDEDEEDDDGDVVEEDDHEENHEQFDINTLKRRNIFESQYADNTPEKRMRTTNLDAPVEAEKSNHDNNDSDLDLTPNFFYNLYNNKINVNGYDKNGIKLEPLSPDGIDYNNENNELLTPTLPTQSQTNEISEIQTEENNLDSNFEMRSDNINDGINIINNNKSVNNNNNLNRNLKNNMSKNIEHNNNIQKNNNLKNDNINNSNKRKVFLCSTCGTYYENWNLFLHMRKIHNKHICLFCLGIFSNGERLSLHLENKHNVTRQYLNTTIDLVDNYLNAVNGKVIPGTKNVSNININNKNNNTNKLFDSSVLTSSTKTAALPAEESSALYLMCCQCEHIFDNKDDDSDDSNGFKNHNCEKYMHPCTDCGQTYPHKQNCPQQKHQKQKTKPSTTKLNNVNNNIYSSSSSDSNSNNNLISDGAVKNTKNSIENSENLNNSIISYYDDGLDDNSNDDNATILSATQTTLDNTVVDNSFNQLFSNHYSLTKDTFDNQQQHQNHHPEQQNQLNHLQQQNHHRRQESKSHDNENIDKNIQYNNNENGKYNINLQKDRISSPYIVTNNFNESAREEEIKNYNNDLGVNCANNYNSDNNNESKSQNDEQETMPKLLVPKLKVKIPKTYQHSRIDSEESSTSTDEEEEPEEDEDEELEDEAEDLDDEYDEGDEEDINNEEKPLFNDDIHAHANTELSNEGEMSDYAAEKVSQSGNEITTDERIIKDEMSNGMDNSAIGTDMISRLTEQINDEVIKELMADGDEAIPNENTSTYKTESAADEEKPENSPKIQLNDEQEIDSYTNGPTSIDEESTSPIKDMINDGITLAGPEIPINDLLLNKPLMKFEILEFMRICLQATIPICLYCNHARKIAVNAQSLALHVLENHRFQATVDSITAEELLPETIVAKLKSFLLTEEDRIEMDSIYFNSDNYDSRTIEKFERIPFDKLYECFQCRFVTPTHKELYLHNRKMHQKSIIICQMCDQQFYSYSELLCHMCPGVPNKFIILDYKYRCCLCNLDNITSAFRLMVHLRKRHFACDVCLEECFDQSRLSNHVWKHKLHHLCYRCGIAYRNKVDITKHLFWKHGTESASCKRCLQKKWPHVYHFCIPPAQFICETCNLIFSRAVSLKVHKRLHTGDAPYPCTEDNCEKKFISRKLLLKHVARHVEKPATTDVASETILIKQEKGEDVQPTEASTDALSIEPKAEIDKNNAAKNISNDADAKASDAKALKKKNKKSKHDSKSKNILDLMQKLQPVNLSESDSSDESENESAAPPASTISENESQSKDAIRNTPEKDVVPSNATDDVVEGEETNNKPTYVPDIWDNFKSYQATHKKSVGNSDDDANDEDNIKEPSLIHVIQSDHDYSALYDKRLDGRADGASSPSKNANESSPVCSKSPKKNKNGKSPKKSKHSESSSSDSTSDSDSSCTCGSNCSCSSSSSSNSSSSSDDSDSSNDEDTTAKRKNKETTGKLKLKPIVNPVVEKAIDVVGPEKPVHIDPDTIIVESDLETDESETDEDFYDEHPQKVANQLLAEKRQQLMMQTCMNPLNNYFIVENSRPSTPSLPEEVAIKKKVKVKKKKKERRNAKNSTHVTQNIPPAANIPVLDNYPAFIPKKELATPVMTPVPDIPLSTIVNPIIIPPANTMALNMAASIKSIDETRLSVSSESDANLKRSKRRRIPNKFYGYCSDDEIAAANVLNNSAAAAYKPTPPPNLTWCKEDLPSPPNSLSNSFVTERDNKLNVKIKINRKSLTKIGASGEKVGQKKYKKRQQTKQPMADRSMTTANALYNKPPPIPPVIIRPSLISMAQPPRVEPIRIPAVPVQHINFHNFPKNNAGYSTDSNDDSDSSDEGTLQINQDPIKKKKLPKLKLSTLSNRKISKKMEEVINEQLPRQQQPHLSANNYQQQRHQQLKQQQHQQQQLLYQQQKHQMPHSIMNGMSSSVAGGAGIGSSGSGSNNTTITSFTPPTTIMPPAPLQVPILNNNLNHQNPNDVLQQQLATQHNPVQTNNNYPALQIPESVYQSNQIRLPIMPPAGCRPARQGESVYCYCRCPYDEVSEMIACDGSSCSIEWFHFECVNIIMPPKGKWYCPECLPKYVDSNGVPYQNQIEC